MPVTQIKPGGGWSSDQPNEEIGPQFITRAINVRSVDGSLSRALPFSPVLGTALFPPRFLMPNTIAGNAFWAYANNTGVGVTDGFTHKDVTPVGFPDHTGVANPFTGGIVNQLPVLNSLLDGPTYWQQDFGTPSLFIPLPDWPVADQAQAMRPFREFLIAMNITQGGVEFPDLLRWSDAAPPGDVPQSWTPGVQSQAGEVSVSFNPGALVDGKQLLDRFFVYKTQSTYVMTLVGGVFVFNQRPIFATVGCLARGCIAEWRGQHMLLTDGDLVAHDGINVKSIASNRLRREIFQNLDGDNFENSYLAISTAKNTLYICRPTTGEEFPTEAITLNLDDLSFGHQSLVATGTPHIVDGLINTDDSVQRNWSDKTTLWNNDETRWNEADFSRINNEVILADPVNLKFQELGLGTDFDGTPMVTLAEREGIALGDPRTRKYVRRLFPRFYGGEGNTVQVQVGATDQPDSAPVYSPVQDFVIGVDRYVNVSVAGFYLAYRFSTTGGIFWQLPNFDVEFELMGEY